jgi:DNA polymerase III epsilon subunit-like protein
MLLRNAKNFNRVVYFDLETTGFNIFHNEIIEIAAIDNFGNSFSTLIQNEKPIPSKITEITKINADMLVGQIKIKEGLSDLIEFISGENDILQIPDDCKRYAKYCIGHNALAFDYPFIKSQCKNHNLKLPDIKIIDTMKMSQYLLPNNYSHSLSSLCNMFKIEHNNAHRALSDVKVTSELFTILRTLYVNKHYLTGIQFDTVNEHIFKNTSI